MKILVSGDFCPQHRVAKLFEEGDFSSVLGEVKPIVESADYAIVNFECPVTLGGEQPIEKMGPNLHCSEKGVEAIRWAGFDCVTLANNHFRDFGTDGVSNTLKSCKKHGLKTVGGGMNIAEASLTLYEVIHGKTLAIINCCEHEFSIATENTAGSNPLNLVQHYYAIQEARQKADHVLVIIHGGHEHYQLPSIRMQETYRFFIDAGADAVVNHHQHCFSGYEIYKGKPIFYGLGNFCFDKAKKMANRWYEGYMVTIDFGLTIDFIIHPYIQCHKEPCVQILTRNAYAESIEKLNNIIVHQKILRKRQDEFYLHEAVKYKQLLEPFNNRFLLALQRRKLLPSFITKRRKLMAIDFIVCESHRDRLIFHLNRT